MTIFMDRLWERRDFVNEEGQTRLVTLLFKNQLTDIINETSLDPNKDPEVTNARGTFDTIGLRLDDSDK